MAYSTSITYESILRVGGKRTHRYKIVETEASASDQWRLDQTAAGVPTGFPTPPTGRVVLLQAEVTSPGGRTIRTRLGKASGWTEDTYDDIDGPAAAAAYLFEATPLPYAFDPQVTPVMFGRSNASAGADNSIRTLLVIEEM
ncbi:MAG: hypothetical protein ABL912_01955 [Novosphingobium sp.]